jgi:hypothetical protein
MALNKLGNITLCFYTKKPFDECHCEECLKDFKLREQMKANSYVLDAADNKEVF